MWFHEWLLRLILFIYRIYLLIKMIHSFPRDWKKAILLFFFFYTNDSFILIWILFIYLFIWQIITFQLIFRHYCRDTCRERGIIFQMKNSFSHVSNTMVCEAYVSVRPEVPSFTAPCVVLSLRSCPHWLARWPLNHWCA